MFRTQPGIADDDDDDDRTRRTGTGKLQHKSLSLMDEIEDPN